MSSPEPEDEETRERVAAESKRREEIAGWLDAATADDLLDALGRRYPEFVLAIAEPHPLSPRKRRHTFSYAGGAAAALGLATYAAREIEFEMTHPEPDEDD
jgi:hypothetical protein